jgi:hypothetical protein
MITKLTELIAKLPPTERTLCERLFLVTVEEGELRVPPAMRPFVLKNFGSVAAVERQKVVRVTNRITLECAIFNELRSQRPQHTNSQDIEQLIEEGRGESDPFNEPLESAEDTFGRVEGAYSITASNVAKLGAWHGVVIFNEFHPLKWEAPHIIDYLMTAREWAEAAHQEDPEAVYFSFLWNCLWKAGASVIHGHSQMVLGREMHYGMVERLRRDALAYRDKYKRGNYFNDLVQAHRALGLTADPADRVKAMAYLTPNASKEFILLTDLYSPELGEGLYKVLAYYKSIGVNSFNVVVQMPPIGESNEDWGGFPVLARIVDRGDLRNRASDQGSIDLFAAKAIVSDPFKLASGFRDWLRKNP